LPDADRLARALLELQSLAEQLRRECSWDRAQTERTIVPHTVEEAWFPEGQRVLRQGFSGTGFYVIVDGEVAINIDGQERARLGRGDFFGEVSVLLGEAPVADVIALRPLRCLHLPGPALRDFLLAHPRVLLRMLVDQTRRLRNANQWRR